MGVNNMAPLTEGERIHLEETVECLQSALRSNQSGYARIHADAIRAKMDEVYRRDNPEPKREAEKQKGDGRVVAILMRDIQLVGLIIIILGMTLIKIKKGD
ncbi:MAG: hypothetical protein KJ879_00865 [Nanoarchaeota archaeon]|nr:hypothetical protein [Nanoarchaeota archaeon]